MHKLLRKTAAALMAVGLLVGGFGNAHAAGQEFGGVSTHEIAPGVFSFLSRSGYHSMFVITDDGVAAFETVNSKHSTDMLAAIRAATDQPVKYALHTHNHWDRASGGAVMQEAGAKTVMHKLAADWLAVNPGPDTTPPDMVWDGARKDIALGDVTIQMHYFGLNHGLGMTVFIIPEHRVA